MKRYAFSEPSFKKRASYPPRISFQELLEEFGVKRTVLIKALGEAGAPKHVLQFTGCVHNNTWYDVAEMRAWWAARIQAKTKKETDGTPQS